MKKKKKNRTLILPREIDISAGKMTYGQRIELGKIFENAETNELRKFEQVFECMHKFTPLKWAKVKDLTFKSDTDAKRWAYFVTKKIREEGTELYRSKRTEDIFETPVADFTERLAERIAGVFQTRIENEIFNF
ncbi:MAG: hypothetical protein FWF72_05465 [Paludibacter sp.]|nr:hypothetical protein [Paludibacter sp.]